jgi:hypothetical protein
MPTVEDRSRYQSDFGISWPRLPVLVAAALLTAVVVAWGLKFTYVHNWYLIMLVPLAGGGLLAGVLYALVGWAHCRNSWLAAVVGVLAGLIAYLGYYQFCLMDLLPPGVGWRVDLLPKFIAMRMQTDVVEDVAKPQMNQQPKKPVAFMNYFAFGMELLMVVGTATTAAWIRSRQAYCTELGRWMRRETALLAPHSITSFRTALDNSTLPQFVAQTARGGDPQSSSALILEYAEPDAGSAFEFPFYASYEDFPQSRSWFRPGRFRRTVLRQVEMEWEEVLALRPLFPKMSRLLESQHAELRHIPATAPAEPSPPLPAGECAEITAVPEPYRKRVQGKGYALRVNLIGATPLIYLFAGMGLLAGGIWLVKFESIPLGCIALVAGAAGFLWGIYVSQFCTSVPENRWIERRLRREIGSRPEKLVDPQDPESIFVSIIPRASFAKVQWTMASDVLLLKLDKSRRQLIMEGDSDRYRIPAGAISVCEPQCFFHPIDVKHEKQLWMVRLMIRVEQGWQELLLSVNSTRWSPTTNARRKERAEDMCRQVEELCGREKSTASPV